MNLGKFLGGPGVPLVSVEDYRSRARRRLPRFVFDFVDGGAADDRVVAANVAAIQKLTFRPRPMVDVSVRDQSVDVFGARIASPVILAPTGLTRLVHPGGELAAAKAAARFGTIYTLSSAASFSIEEVAAAEPAPVRWFQAIIWRQRSLVESLLDRAAEQEYQALVVTVDTPVPGRKDRDRRNGFTMPPRITLRNAADTVRRVRWMRDLLTQPPINFKNFAAMNLGAGDDVVSLASYVERELSNPAATWRDLQWIRARWKGPLIIKGVLTAEAARLAYENGADAVVVSNHGGRQFPAMPPTIEVLPQVVEMASGYPGRVVFVDGGFRRGSDALKAIALGARAVLIGRPYIWGLAVAGEAGAIGVLQLFQAEIDNLMAGLGVKRLDELNSSFLNGILDPTERAESRKSNGPRASVPARATSAAARA